VLGREWSKRTHGPFQGPPEGVTFLFGSCFHSEENAVIIHTVLYSLIHAIVFQVGKYVGALREYNIHNTKRHALTFKGCPTWEVNGIC
jgi:hypothetical protein